MSGTSQIHTYVKPYRTVTAQIALLQSRGMEITDTAAAAACLGRIGYYRLSGYWYASRKSHVTTNPLTDAIVPHPVTGKPQVIVEDDFRSGTTFQQVMDLYVFDKRLRLLFMDAIERVEVALRVDIALLIGARDPWAHRDPTQLHGNFTKKVNPLHGQTDYARWLERLDQTFDRSKDEFVKHFKRKYAGEKPPIWIAIELWDFGMLSVFLGGMTVADQQQLAVRYGLPRSALLTSWSRNINNVRNMCAHHSRLWNRSPADQGSTVKRGEIPILDHLVSDLSAQSRIYTTAAALQFLLRTINPASSWGARLRDLLSTFPASDVSTIRQAGFPLGWERMPLWN
jgi:abortive infection bacteriophage resistance protein